MYIIKATDNFIKTISDLPLKILHELTLTFISVKKVENDLFADDKSTFLDDLLEQIKNQEKE